MTALSVTSEREWLYKSLSLDAVLLGHMAKRRIHRYRRITITRLKAFATSVPTHRADPGLLGGIRIRRCNLGTSTMRLLVLFVVKTKSSGTAAILRGGQACCVEFLQSNQPRACFGRMTTTRSIARSGRLSFPGSQKATLG